MWQPTRRAAFARLQDFIPRAGRRYAADRNADLGPEVRTNVSGLSPYIRHRLILEEEVLAATLEHHSSAAADKFVQEVFWRTYFKGWLEQRPQVWIRYRAELERWINRLHDEPSQQERYMRATQGRTGIHCFDSWTSELVDTGYLHNHARMWFASIWIFTLKLPWQLGADFFYRHLLDGDPASNTLGWRWVGGLHTKGKTYLARASNIARYTHQRFNPRHQLAATAPALSEPESDERVPLPPAVASLPREERFGLLVTEEDCCLETLALTGSPVAAIGLTATEDRSPLPVGGLASSFATEAVKDGLLRLEERFDVETTQASSVDWGKMLVEWAHRNKLRVVVTGYAPVGPVSARLLEAGRELKSHGIELIPIQRPYDAVTWPHAGKGFFGLKTQIPALLRELGLGDETSCGRPGSPRYTAAMPQG